MIKNTCRLLSLLAIILGSILAIPVVAIVGMLGGPIICVGSWLVFAVPEWCGNVNRWFEGME